MAVQSVCGVILVTTDVEALAGFYAEVLGVSFEREEHGGLEVHYGVDLGSVHFGIHPPGSFAGRGPSRGTAIAFAVDALQPHFDKAVEKGAEIIAEPRDEGFGLVVSLADPEGNLFELVELTYDFKT